MYQKIRTKQVNDNITLINGNLDTEEIKLLDYLGKI